LWKKGKSKSSGGGTGKGRREGSLNVGTLWRMGKRKNKGSRIDKSKPGVPKGGLNETSGLRNRHEKPAGVKL